MRPRVQVGRHLGAVNKKGTPLSGPLLGEEDWGDLGGHDSKTIKVTIK
jgi:hypothetical protein